MEGSVSGILTATAIVSFYTFIAWLDAHRVSRARAMIAKGARAVDVDEPTEFATEDLGGAMNIPLEELPVRAREIGPLEARIVVFGHNKRAALAESELRALGFQHVLRIQLSRW